jgi:hypothetical protein
MTTRINCMLGAGVAVAGLALGAHQAGVSQPEGQPERQPERQSGATDDPVELRVALVRRLEEVRAIESTIQSAIDKLDAGADADDVRQMFRPGSFDGRRRRGPGGEDRADRPPPEASPLDDPEKLDAFLLEHLPEIHDFIERVKERSPEAAERIIQFNKERLGPIAAIQFTDPPLFDLRLDEYRVGAELFGKQREYIQTATDKGADAPDAIGVKNELEALLNRQFDLRIAIHQHEIAAVEQRVSALQKELQQMESERAQSIARRLEFLTDLDRHRRDRRDGDRRRGPR